MHLTLIFETVRLVLTDPLPYAIEMGFQECSKGNAKLLYLEAEHLEREKKKRDFQTVDERETVQLNGLDQTRHGVQLVLQHKQRSKQYIATFAAQRRHVL